MPAEPAKQGDDDLREKLTQLIAMGLHPKYTPEQLWAAQGRGQFPKADPYIDRPPAMTDPNLVTPIRRYSFEPMTELQRFPQADPGPKAPMRQAERDEPPPPPFDGKGVVGDTYKLPPALQKKFEAIEKKKAGR